MANQAGQPAIYRVREDRSCWTVIGAPDVPLGVFLMKGEAINLAWDAARRCRPSVVTVELADGTVEGEFRFGTAGKTGS